MTVTLTAPVTEADYRNMPLLKLPSDFTGDQVTNLLNAAWQMIQGPRGTNQPLTQTTSTFVEEFGKRYCNLSPLGSLVILPRYLPIISVTSIKWTTGIQSGGWTICSYYDIAGDDIQVYDAPFGRGDYGLVQLVYISGYAIIPDDLKMACGLMAAHLFSGALFPDQAGTSVLPIWLPQDVSLIIQKYKRVR